MSNQFLDILKKKINTPSKTGGFPAPTIKNIASTVKSIPVPTITPRPVVDKTSQAYLDEQARKSNSTVGLVSNTIASIPEASVNVFKDILQGIGRSGGMVGLTAYNNSGRFFTEDKEKITQLPESKASKFFFGEKPLRDIPGAVAKTKEDLKPYVGEDVSKYGALPLVVGSIALDLTGFGGPRKALLNGEVPETFLKYLARHDAPTIEKKLVDIGVNPDDARGLAPELGASKNVDEVKNALLNYGKPKALPGEVGPIKAESNPFMDIVKPREVTAPVTLETSAIEGINKNQAVKLTAEEALPLAKKAADIHYTKVHAPAIAEGKIQIIGGDQLKNYFGKDFNDNNHPIYSKAAFEQYGRALKDNPNPTVVFTGGGPASGKTELVIKNLENGGFKGIVYDSNFSNFEGAKNQIAAARTAGKKIELHGVLSDLGKSRTFANQRENAGGHGIVDDTFARGHAGFPATTIELLEKGLIDPSEVFILDTRNTNTWPEAVKKALDGEYVDNVLATLKDLGYNEESIKQTYAKAKFPTKSNTTTKTSIREGSSSTSSENRTNQGRSDRSGDRRPILEVKQGKGVSRVDKLIAEGKIRVVSRNGRDVYQYKKGGEWVNARDEDSAVKQVTFVPAKKEIVLPKNLSEKKIELEIRKEQLDLNPAKELEKYYDPKLGRIPEANPTAKQLANKKLPVSKWRKDGDQIADNLGFEDSEAARNAFDDYLGEKKAIREEIKQFNAEKKAVVAESKIPKASEKPTPSPAPKISQIDTTKGEGRSIEIQAHQAEELLRGEPVVGNVSLPTIIQKTVTPVQKKVHVIDTFLTTPRIVMEKIGFGKEAKALRDGMDAYWKELPKNLDKITAWSKEVPKESNVRIFRWLDGEALDLTPAEMKVGTEIKAWLKEWAKRLDLPADNTIGHYITHIFDRELMTKEFDEDLAKIIADRIPGSVYDPFMLKRLGAKGYKQDTWGALDAYVKRGTRKVHMDPVLEAIQEKTGPSLDMSNIEKSQFNYIKQYIDNINLRPNEAEEGVDNFIKSVVGYKWGQRPVTVLLRRLRQMSFRGALGLNPASALRNLSQGANTYAELGERYTATGYVSLFKKGAGAELKREGILNAGFVQDRALSSTKKALEKIDKGLFAFFNTAEHINRGAAYFGAKAKALNQGMDEAQAIEFAKKVVRKTQFVFDSVDTPVGMSSDIMKTLFQFQTFTTKQIEFLGGKVKGSFYGQEKARNIAGLLRYALAGTAFVYTIGKAFGMKPEEILPWYRFQTPVSLKAPVEITKALLNTPDKYGQPRDLVQKGKDIANSAITLIPGGSQMKKTYQGYQAIKEGGSYDKNGKLQFKQGTSLKEKAQALIFGKYASPEAQNYFNKIEIKSDEFKKIAPIYDEVKALDAQDRGDEAQALVDELTEEEYAIYKKYKTAEKTKATLQAKKEMIPLYKKIQEVSEEEAQIMLDGMTDEEYRIYGLVKKDFANQTKASEGDKPEYTAGEAQDEQGLIKTVFTYAKAIGVDPATAFNRIFSGQRIRRVDNKAIIVERMTLPESQKVKNDRGATANMKLDHTLPLQLGGSNDLDNLKLIDSEIWASYTPVENYLGKQLRDKKITKKEAQDLIIRFKNGEISAEEILN